MERLKYIGFLLLLITFFPGFGQDDMPNCIGADLNLPAEYNDQFMLFTDRNFYVAGEKIFFKVQNLCASEVYNAQWSRVLYLEILKQEGISVCKAKFPINNNMLNGYLNIPSDIESGIYYIVPYTKWMRNFNDSSFRYFKITIINPFYETISGFFPSANEKHETVGIKNINKKGAIICKTDKKVYSQREKVNVTIEIPKTISKIFNNSFCVTVVRPSCIGTENSFYTSKMDEEDNQPKLRYIPEMNGLSVSGRLIANTDDTIEGSIVDLSVLDNNAYYSTCEVLQNGCFLFSLPPYDGVNDIFISTNDAHKKIQNIKIDDDFKLFEKPISNEKLQLDSSKTELAKEVMLNMQLENSYRNIEMDSITDQRFMDTVPTYKYTYKPTSIEYLRDYINLPTLEEVFFEIIKDVFVVKKKNIKSLRIEGTPLLATYMSLYKPLVLIDNVPVLNMQSLLAIAPDKIERVEVLKEIYITGENIYGGMINVISKKGDLAGYELPENSFFISFPGYYMQEPVSFPCYKSAKGNMRIPDRRNCLYWEPSIEVMPGEKKNISFYTSDSKKEYIIKVSGLTDTGEIIEGSTRFIVE